MNKKQIFLRIVLPVLLKYSVLTLIVLGLMMFIDICIEEEEITKEIREYLESYEHPEGIYYSGPAYSIYVEGEEIVYREDEDEFRGHVCYVSKDYMCFERYKLEDRKTYVYKSDHNFENATKIFSYPGRISLRMITSNQIFYIDDKGECYVYYVDSGITKKHKYDVTYLYEIEYENDMFKCDFNENQSLEITNKATGETKRVSKEKILKDSVASWVYGKYDRYFSILQPFLVDDKIYIQCAAGLGFVLTYIYDFETHEIMFYDWIYCADPNWLITYFD